MKLTQIRKILMRFPGIEEAPSYGTAGFRVRKKLLARMHHKEAAIVLRVLDLSEQEALIQMDPSVFYITDHYQGHPYVLARLSTIQPSQLLDVVEQAWRRAASKRQIAEYEAG